MLDETSKNPNTFWPSDEHILQDIERRVGKPPRRMSWLRLPAARSKPPKWLTENDPVSAIFAHQRQIVRDGEVRWAHIVQANNLIFAPGPEDSGAQVIYAPSGNIPLKVMGEIAHRAFAQKGTQPMDPAERKVANMLTDEMERALDWPMPKTLTGGRSLITTIVILPRSHMPGRLMAMKFFPIFADPATKMATLIPQRYWPEELTAEWQERAAGVIRNWEVEQVERKHRAETNTEVGGSHIVDITAAAAVRIREILIQNKIKNGWLHVFADFSDGAFKHGLKFEAKQPDKKKQVAYECRGVQIVVDREHIDYLKGTTLDFRNDPRGSGFVFNNPNTLAR